MQDYNRNITEVKMGEHHLVTIKAISGVILEVWKASTWLRQRLSEKDWSSIE